MPPKRKVCKPEANKATRKRTKIGDINWDPEGEVTHSMNKHRVTKKHKTLFTAKTELVEDAKGTGVKRDKHGKLLFNDYQEFKPNLSPKEILQAGSFGGTYFRPISSSVTGKFVCTAISHSPLPQPRQANSSVKSS